MDEAANHTEGLAIEMARAVNDRTGAIDHEEDGEIRRIDAIGERQLGVERDRVGDAEVAGVAYRVVGSSPASTPTTTSPSAANAPASRASCGNHLAAFLAPAGPDVEHDDLAAIALERCEANGAGIDGTALRLSALLPLASQGIDERVPSRGSSRTAGRAAPQPISASASTSSFTAASRRSARRP